jgi:hypothetical protein
MRRIVVVVACAVGCTAANPGYVGGVSRGALDAGAPPIGGVGGGGGGGGGGSSGGGGGGGASGAADLALVADLGHSGECAAGERRCVTAPSPTSEACVDGSFTADRPCPYFAFNASCANGYCAGPATKAASCDQGGAADVDCANSGGPVRYSCEPFITDAATAAVAWWCAVAITAAVGGAGTACTSDGDCRTGFCGANGTCFVACRAATDCPTARLRCAAVTITVEGVTVHARSCVP